MCTPEVRAEIVKMQTGNAIRIAVLRQRLGANPIISMVSCLSGYTKCLWPRLRHMKRGNRVTVSFLLAGLPHMVRGSLSGYWLLGVRTTLASGGQGRDWPASGQVGGESGQRALGDGVESAVSWLRLPSSGEARWLDVAGSPAGDGQSHVRGRRLPSPAPAEGLAAAPALAREAPGSHGALPVLGAQDRLLASGGGRGAGCGSRALCVLRV